MKNTADKTPFVFLDTNILIDYVLFRGDEALAAEYIFECSMNGDIDLYIAAHSLTDMFYILRKEYSSSERKMIIRNLCALCRVVPISAENIEKAVLAGFSDDLEDSIQIQCAVESGCDYLVTRDAELFSESPVRVVLPHELIRELSL